MSTTDAMLERFTALNRETSAHWSVFAAHRQRVTDLIVASCLSDANQVALLGAGNCNDVDLPTLLRFARRLDLLDVDQEAMQQGVKRQGLEGSVAIALHAEVDLTGAVAALASLASVSSEDALVAYSARLEQVPPLPGAGDCDVVVSCCLLTALISSIVDALGPGHPATAGLVSRVRDQHLRVLAAHLAPGGRALLVTDFVSSDTCPALLDAADDALGPMMAESVAQRNFFTGTNPIVVTQRVRRLLHDFVHEIHAVGPWRWHISAGRAYLVYAITFSRRL